MLTTKTKAFVSVLQGGLLLWKLPNLTWARRRCFFLRSLGLDWLGGRLLVNEDELPEGPAFDEIREIISQINRLPKEERKGYLMSAYSCHLSKRDPERLLQRIHDFNLLNLCNLSDKELLDAIYNVLCDEGRFSCFVSYVQYQANTRFYRVRDLGKRDNPLDALHTWQDVWEPPKECVRQMGRLNKAHESLLYVTPGDPRVPLQEVEIAAGNHFLFICYVFTEPISATVIGAEPDYDSAGITDKNARINGRILSEFLADEFSREVGVGTEYLYRVSEAIAKEFYDGPPKVQDAWAYRSMRDKSKYNVCFRPEKAHDKLKFCQAMICEKRLDGTIRPLYLVLRDVNDDEFYFSRVMAPE